MARLKRGRTCVAFKKRVNMSPDSIEKWARDERAREAGDPDQLPQLAGLKRKKCAKWTDDDVQLAKRVLAKVEKLDAAGCTRKAVLDLRNAGHQSKCGLPPKMTVEGDAAKLQLAGGKTVVVDRRDAERITRPLRVTEGYASFQDGRRTALLHRELMGLPPGEKLVVDHINRDRLDNRRSNLRVVTQSVNNRNRRSWKRKR